MKFPGSSRIDGIEHTIHVSTGRLIQTPCIFVTQSIFVYPRSAKNLLIFEFETPRTPDYGFPLSFIPSYHVVTALVTFHMIAAPPTTTANLSATAQSGGSIAAAATLGEVVLLELDVAELVWEPVLEVETVDTGRSSAIASSSPFNEWHKRLPT